MDHTKYYHRLCLAKLLKNIFFSLARGVLISLHVKCKLLHYISTSIHFKMFELLNTFIIIILKLLGKSLI